ncbi:hypothetical protein TWF694_008048 [Orbilia ellipsospora]|uniref:Uncharacterized protein n=1 Tax=Orbilia ellipsospora TaxID=2528407 RepID=A0AAV9XEX4_9PEZI
MIIPDKLFFLNVESQQFLGGIKFQDSDATPLEGNSKAVPRENYLWQLEPVPSTYHFHISLEQLSAYASLSDNTITLSKEPYPWEILQIPSGDMVIRDPTSKTAWSFAPSKDPKVVLMPLLRGASGNPLRLKIFRDEPVPESPYELPVSIQLPMSPMTPLSPPPMCPLPRLPIDDLPSPTADRD